MPLANTDALDKAGHTSAPKDWDGFLQLLSLTDWDGHSADYAGVGLRNFTRLATEDDTFANAVGTNLKLTVTVVLAQTAPGLLLALWLVRTAWASTLLRAVFFLPTHRPLHALPRRLREAPGAPHHVGDGPHGHPGPLRHLPQPRHRAHRTSVRAEGGGGNSSTRVLSPVVHS